MNEKVDELRREYQELCDAIFNNWDNGKVSHKQMAAWEEKAEKVLVLINALEIVNQ